MLVHAMLSRPNEACGLLFGSDCTAISSIRLTNISPLSRTAFEVAFEEYEAVLRAGSRSGCTLLATYHSHPKGARGLSRGDLGFARCVRACHLVVAFSKPGISVSAQELTEDVLRPVPLRLVGLHGSRKRWPDVALEEGR